MDVLSDDRLFNIKLYSNLEKQIARSDDTDTALRRFTRVVQSSAQAKLAAHRKHGTHQITVNKGVVDHFVNLEGENALSVEDGWHASNGRFIAGLHILRGSIPS